MKKTSPLIQKASEYVFNLLREQLPVNHIYHNFTHTSEVVEAATEIAEGIEIPKEEAEIIILAAWFHDTGFTQTYAGHEEKSKEIAVRFLTENSYPPEKIEKIKGCIDATRYPQKPTNLLEYVLCDADLSGIASKKYFESANFLRQEQELVLNKKYTDLEWVKLEIEFLTHHKYHTPYCYLAFEKRKISHTLELKKIMEDLEEAEGKRKNRKIKKEEEKAAKDSRPERGIETVFRLTLNNHMNLWKTADDKANFLLAVNSFMLVFAMANIFFIPETAIGFLQLMPAGILMLVCLLSIVFTILSMQPKHYSGNITVEDIEKKSANLMFFGNFQKMKLDEFTWGFNEMMKDREFLYGSMIRELYFLGKVLGRKYFLLRIAYALFMWGIIVAVLSYVAGYCYSFLFFLNQ